MGLGLFVVVGTQLAFQNLPEGKWFAVAFLGTVTGVGGSILRDVLVRDVPYIFRKPFVGKTRRVFRQSQKLPRLQTGEFL